MTSPLLLLGCVLYATFPLRYFSSLSETSLIFEGKERLKNPQTFRCYRHVSPHFTSGRNKPIIPVFPSLPKIKACKSVSACQSVGHSHRTVPGVCHNGEDSIAEEPDGEDQEPVGKGKMMDVLNLLQRQDVPSFPRKIVQLHTSVTFCKSLKSTRDLRSNGR